MTSESFNLNLPGYHLTEELYRNSKTAVYRANQLDELGGVFRPVVIKLLSVADPTERDLLEFSHQYEIVKDLDIPGIVRVYSLEECDAPDLRLRQHSYALVMEDFGGMSLARSGQQQQLSLADILKIAIQLAQTLHALGQQRIVHKDIQPANILIHPMTKQVKLIDFGIVAQLPHHPPPAPTGTNLLVETFAYIAPEQTGRMNRGIDYRTDFYALGVTLYELLTGKLPFETDAPLDLIYCHLAQIATPVDRVNPEIPPIVSQIVAKLMAKTAEDRYQSALGLKYDLEQCSSQLQATGTIAEFSLGERDLGDRFIIPERLYGREASVQTAIDALAKIEIDRAKLQKWADAAPMNHLHKLQLVDAELHRGLGNRAEAIEAYDLAISGAKTHGYIQEEALANELAAIFYLDWGKTQIAASYMQEAYYCYSRWGAKAKTGDLERRYPQLLAASGQPAINPLSALATVTHFNSNSSNQTSNSLDLVSVLQSAQVLSSTIELEELIHRLSQIILNNAGAETCILVLPDRDGDWLVRAVATVQTSCPLSESLMSQSLAMPLGTRIATNLDCPANLIYWVKNTRSTIICDARQAIEIDDPYLRTHQPQSVFALPIVKQERVLGVLYLEHRHAPDIFTENTKTVISFLCTQAAIALENARLYQESQQAIDNTRLQQSYLEALLNNIPHLAWLKDRDGRFIAVNQSLGKLVDLHPLEFGNKTDFNLWPRALAEQYRADDAFVMASGKRKIVEERTLTIEGEQRWLETIKTPIRDNDGEITGTVGIALDITDRKQAELELLASKQFLQTVLDSFPLFIFWKDRHSVYQGGNQKFVIGTGLASSAELVGKTDYDLPWDTAEADAFRADDRQVIETETVKLGIIETQVQLDGSQIWLETNKVPLRNPAGEVIGVVGTYQDVTDRQRSQIELQMSNERLELTVRELQRATRLKDEFLATMSHELRTPLNAILGMSEALQEQIFGAVNDRQIKSLKTIERSGRHLLSLINDILDVSKISAGKLELAINTVSIHQLCYSSLAFVKQQALQKQIQLDVQLPPAGGNITVDERRMRQVTINLLSNAVKFTPNGGQIVLRVKRSERGGEDDLGWLELTVTDTGIGIARKDFDRLFQPFVQLDSSLNRHYQGTGLGLTLVQQIVELHGGSISVQSELDLGSCFTVRLPGTCLVPLDNNPLPPVDTPSDDATLDLHPIEPALILLTEDNTANIRTISSYLTAKGYRTILAENGKEAIESVAREHPDLIVMDIQMPEMDGLEAIAWIRGDPELAQIPIVALTALAMEGDREKCLAAGANEYLTKPVKLKQLSATIQQLLRG